jgi:hypothetical protein
MFSPFIHVFTPAPHLLSLFYGEEDGRLVLQFHSKKFPAESLQEVGSIAEAEDYYLSHAITRPRGHETLTRYALNSLTTRVAMNSRRGPGHILLMHPEMFERVKSYPSGFIESGMIAGQLEKCGRWRQVQKIDPSQKISEIWVGDHLPRNETIAVYSNPATPYDSLSVMPSENGFLLSPLHPPGCYSHATYMARDIHPEFEP